MAAERPESSTPCKGIWDSSHMGPSTTLPHRGGGKGTGITCKYVLKMCLAERVMSSPMPIFCKGSEKGVWVRPRPPPSPEARPPSPMAQPSSPGITHIDVVQLLSGRAPHNQVEHLAQVAHVNAPLAHHLG